MTKHTGAIRENSPLQRRFPDLVVVHTTGQRGHADQPLQPTRGRKPHTTLRALAKMGADLFRGVIRLLPVDFGGKSGSTVDAPHKTIIAHNVRLSQKPGYKRVRNLRGRGAAACAAASILLLAGCGQTGSTGSPNTSEFDYYLDLAETPMSAPPHEFRTVDGDPWAFTDVAADRLTLLYFGYTSCPDVCPTTMADIADAVTRLGADGEQVDVVMVSTDPERDTPEQMRSWLSGFNPDFQGVIGPIDDVVQAAKAYGIPVEPPEETDGNYLVTHGERVAVLRPGGDAIGFFDPGTSGEQMSAVLPELIAAQL